MLPVLAQPSARKPVLLGLPGTLISPEVFLGLPKDPVDVVPVSWMEASGPWDLTTLADDLAAGIDEPVLVAGHSTGGALALVTALRHPGRVRGLLLSGTGASFAGHGDADPIIEAVRHQWGPSVRTRVLQRCFHYPPPPSLTARLDAYAARVSQQAVIDVLESQRDTDLRPSLPRVGCPVVVAHGRHDPVRPIAHAHELVTGLANAQLVLLDAGHTPMVEDPAGYGHALRQLTTRAYKHVP